jgi:hypothetical protein
VLVDEVATEEEGRAHERRKTRGVNRVEDLPPQAVVCWQLPGWEEKQQQLQAEEEAAKAAVRAEAAELKKAAREKAARAASTSVSGSSSGGSAAKSGHDHGRGEGFAWSAADDKLLRKLVNSTGTSQWEDKARQLGGSRSANAVAHRWRKLETAAGSGGGSGAGGGSHKKKADVGQSKFNMDADLMQCGTWGDSEREKLLELVATHGTGNWSERAAQLAKINWGKSTGDNQRSAAGCRLAYYATVVPRPKTFKRGALTMVNQTTNASAELSSSKKRGSLSAGGAEETSKRQRSDPSNSANPCD